MYLGLLKKNLERLLDANPTLTPVIKGFRIYFQKIISYGITT